MFAYCCNNPILYADPTGCVPIFPVCWGGNGSPLKMGPYDSPDEAARAFSEYIYSSSLYIRHEYGTQIYYFPGDGQTYYYFNYPTEGNPHSVSIGAPVPEGAIMIAYAHTHPNQNTFSNKDKQVADFYNYDGYVVGPNLVLQKYCVSTREIRSIGLIIPRTLSALDKAILRSQFYASWMQHVSGNCCTTISWPTN